MERYIRIYLCWCLHVGVARVGIKFNKELKFPQESFYLCLLKFRIVLAPINYPLPLSIHRLNNA